MPNKCIHLKGPVTVGPDEEWYYCTDENCFVLPAPAPPPPKGKWRPGLLPEIVKRCRTGKCPRPRPGEYVWIVVEDE
jgi:hypothetical protein